MSVIYRALRKLQQEDLKKDLPAARAPEDAVAVGERVLGFVRAHPGPVASGAIAAIVAIVTLTAFFLMPDDQSATAPTASKDENVPAQPDTLEATGDIETVETEGDIAVVDEDAFERFLTSAVLPSLPGTSGRPTVSSSDAPTLDALAERLGSSATRTASLRQAPAIADVPPPIDAPQVTDRIGDAPGPRDHEPAAEPSPRARTTNRAPVVAVTRVVKVGQMAREVRKAIAEGDGAKVDRGLSELSRVKGKSDPFVMKLRAYWHITKGEYEPAEDLLYRVLKARSVDMEAGLNLAVIEARTGRLERARTRARSLLNLYPDETRVRRLVEELKR